MAKASLNKRREKLFVFSFILLGFLSVVSGQENKVFVIRGRLLDSLNREPLMFATVAVRRNTDAAFITGSSAGSEGYFEISSLEPGKFELQISALGYGKEIMAVDVKADTDLGEIFLQQQTALLEEVTIAGERIKARKDPGSTTYFMNDKIYGVSNTGTDLLSFIPGIQVDLMKNISLNGSSEIMILIDGREKDKNFINQLDPEKIDRVEVMNVPSSRYDETVSGVINIILKEKTDEKLNGHFFADIPVLKSMVYSFPDFSADFRIKKLDFTVSYSGAYSYFDIYESGYKKTESESGIKEITACQLLRQKDWSHSFHFGVDYKLNNNNHISFYSFMNPFSQEFDGDVEYQFSDITAEEKLLKYSRNESDKNLNSHFSLWYRHGFDKEGNELTAEMNYSNFRAYNGTTYISVNPGNDNPGDYTSLTRPLQNSVSFRLDYVLPVSEKMKLDGGIKTRFHTMQDRMPGGFNYGENIFAAYTSLKRDGLKYTFTGGLRAEKSATGLRDSTVFSCFTILPQLSVIRKFTEKQSLELSYNATTYRPDIYKLNPYTSFTDPYTASTGNPDLKSEITHKLKLVWSGSYGNNFITSGLFYESENRSINRYALIHEDGNVESLIGNMGAISKYGVQFSGSLKLNNIITINPWFRIYNMCTSINELAKLNNISPRHRMTLETSVSAIAAFRYDIAFSLRFNYSSPVISMQSDYFSDPLWMISAEKTFRKKFKAGIVTALPFIRSFTYQGSKTDMGSLIIHSQGDLKLPVLPFWLKLGFQFSSGKKTTRNTDTREDIINLPKKGF